MSKPENLQEVAEENIPLVKEFISNQTKLLQLKTVRILSLSLGMLVWLIIALFLILLVFTFGGMMLGFWIGELLGSFAAGFGITTLILLFFIIAITFFRKQLFINPLIGIFIRSLTSQDETEQEPLQKPIHEEF